MVLAPRSTQRKPYLKWELQHLFQALSKGSCFLSNFPKLKHELPLLSELLYETEFVQCPWCQKILRNKQLWSEKKIFLFKNHDYNMGWNGKVEESNLQGRHSLVEIFLPKPHSCMLYNHHCWNHQEVLTSPCSHTYPITWLWFFTALNHIWNYRPCLFIDLVMAAFPC